MEIKQDVERTRRSFVATLALLSGCSATATEVLRTPNRNSQFERAGKWPFARRDTKNTAYLPDGDSLADPRAYWTTSFESRETRYESPPVATEAHLLVTDYGNGSVHAVDPRDGTHRWSLELPGRPEHAPCVVGDAAVVPAGSTLLAVGLDDGSVRHATELSGVAGPPIVSGDTVFVGTSDGNPKAYAVDLRSGNVVWNYPTGLVSTPPAVAGTAVAYADWDGRVHAFDASDGHRRWNFQTRGEFVRSAPVVASGTVFACAGTNRGEGWVHAFDIETGEERWRRHVPDASLSASPATDSSTLYVVDDRSRVHALDLSTGRRRWQTDGRADAAPRQTVDRSPVVTDSVLYYVADNRSLVAVSTVTGRRRWRRETEWEPRTPPILVPDGVVSAGRSSITGLSD